MSEQNRMSLWSSTSSITIFPPNWVGGGGRYRSAGFEGSPIALRCALEVIEPERLIFGTDYSQNFNNSDPKQGKSIDGVAEYVDLIHQLPLTARLKEDMLGGSAARLLNL